LLNGPPGKGNSRRIPCQWNLAASARACFRKGKSVSMPFHRSRNFAYASFAWLAEPDIPSPRATPNFASGADQQLTTMPASAGNFRNSARAYRAFPAPSWASPCKTPESCGSRSDFRSSPTHACHFFAHLAHLIQVVRSVRTALMESFTIALPFHNLSLKPGVAG